MITDSVHVRAVGLTKSYGGIRALREGDIEIRPGYCTGLIGPNGAGKSTLVGCLTGRIASDAGEILLNESPVSFRNARQAVDMGVVAVPQELAVPAGMSLGQFVALGWEPNRLGFVRRKVERSSAQECLARIKLPLDPDMPVEALTPSQARAALIAQALYREARVLLLDEPTAGMSQEQADVLCSLMRTLCDEGLALLFISHRLSEVERTCDTVSVMRDGSIIDRIEGTDLTVAAMVEHLASGLAGESRPVPPTPDLSDPLIVVEGLPLQHGTASFTVYRGELLGLAGLPSSGVEAAFQAITGVGRPAKGVVVAGGRSIRSPEGAISAGVAYLPPSRSDSAILDQTVTRNIVLSALPTMSRGGFLRQQHERRAAAPVAEAVQVAPVLDRMMSSLSGGNQQRSLIGRLLMTGADTIVLEDPTLGVDVAARAAIHDLLKGLVASGRSCVVGSSEPEELALLCNRVLIFRSGQLVQELTGTEVTERRIIQGITSHEKVS